jgi:hypothetical protein
MPLMAAINGARASFALSRQTDNSLPLSRLPLLQRMVSNDNDKRKREEEAECSKVRKRLQHTDDNGGDDDSSDSFNSPEEESSEEEEMEVVEEEEDETKEEVSSEEMLMNQLDTIEEKLYARRARDYLFSDDGDTPSTLPDTPPTPESRRCSDEESSDDNDF